MRTRLEIVIAGTAYEVDAVYERLPGDGGPGWCIEQITPEPPDRATEREIERRARDAAEEGGFDHVG